MAETSIRPIAAIDYNRAVPCERGPVPELRWLAIAELVVDEAYQRPITSQGLKTIRAIVENFDWRMFAPVVVCPIEGGVYALVDGQHRTTAALTCGIDRVPALIVQAERATQARAFGAINGRVTKMMPTSLFKARLAAGEPGASRLNTVAEAAGVKVLTYHPSWSTIRPGQTTAFVSLEKALKAHGEDILGRCLSALVASAGDDAGIITSVTIGAFVNVLVDHREYLEHRDLLAVAGRFSLRRKLDLVIEDAAKRRMPRQPLLEAALLTHFSRPAPAGLDS